MNSFKTIRPDDREVGLGSQPFHITIMGILIPVGWAANGMVTELAVAAFDEMEYHLSEDTQTDKWKNYLNQEVIVTGISYDKDGCRWLDVKTFHKAD